MRDLRRLFTIPLFSLAVVKFCALTAAFLFILPISRWFFCRTQHCSMHSHFSLVSNFLLNTGLLYTRNSHLALAPSNRKSFPYINIIVCP